MKIYNQSIIWFADSSLSKATRVGLASDGTCPIGVYRIQTPDQGDAQKAIHVATPDVVTSIASEQGTDTREGDVAGEDPGEVISFIVSAAVGDEAAPDVTPILDHQASRHNQHFFRIFREN